MVSRYGNDCGWKLQHVEFPGVNQKVCGQLTKKPHSLEVPFFGPGIFDKRYTLYGFTLAMTFDFSRISKTNPETSVEYLQRHFLNHPACFFLEKATDRQIDFLFQVLKYLAHCTDLERLPEPPQNKICYILHPKYTSFSCFPIICSSVI